MPKGPTTPQQLAAHHIRELQIAHTDLNTMHAIIAILEGGCIYTGSGQQTADKIIKLAKAEGARQLHKMDAELSLAIADLPRD